MDDIKLNCIVVDDSTIQRISITKLVKDHPNLELIAEHNNAIKVKETLKNEDIDLIFLDIEMPIISGFDLLDNLEKQPQIIFITGKTQYAFKAFDYKAIDFLQKPVSAKRFDYAISKVLDFFKLRIEKERISDDNYIMIKSNFKNFKVFLDDIKYVQAFGDYVKVVTKEQTYTVLSTLKGFNERLPSDQFLRVHKSYIVNLSKIKKYESKNLWIKDIEIPISRNRKKELDFAMASVGIS